MTCRSYFLSAMSPFCFHFSTVLAKKLSFSRAELVSVPFFFSLSILTTDRVENARSRVQSIIHLRQQERNGMRSQIKKAKQKKVECKMPFQLICKRCVTCFLIVIECRSQFSSLLLLPLTLLRSLRDGKKLGERSSVQVHNQYIVLYKLTKFVRRRGLLRWNLE